jgi:hypothetical protein
MNLRKHLEVQGFRCSVGESNDLRFTPAVSAAVLFAATALRSPPIFFVFALVSLAGAAGLHAFDFAYDHLVRPLFGGRRLPPNPRPRRFSMALAALVSTVAGVMLATGSRFIGAALGVALVIAALLAASIHFCTGAWIYRLLGLHRPGGLGRFPPRSPRDTPMG